MVMFDAANIADATRYYICDRYTEGVLDTFNSGTAPDAGTAIAYNTFATAGDGNLNNWVAIPEPMTIAILVPGFGLLGLWRRRKFNTVRFGAVKSAAEIVCESAERGKVRDINRVRDWMMLRQTSR